VGTITGQQIADRAWIKVNEATGSSATRWTPAEALLWLNDGQREIVHQLPKANPQRATPTIAAGTRQTLTGLGLTNGIQVLDVVRNMAADGTTPGRAIIKRDRAWLDVRKPSWHSDTASDAYDWMFDDRDPKAFYIYPAKTSGKIEIIYSALPTDLTVIGDAIALDDIYANALQWFMLFSFYSKDATFNRGQQAAASYWALFMQALGLRDKSVAEASAQGDARVSGNG
jgi:hypothetical protein